MEWEKIQRTDRRKCTKALWTLHCQCLTFKNLHKFIICMFKNSWREAHWSSQCNIWKGDTSSKHTVNICLALQHKYNSYQNQTEFLGLTVRKDRAKLNLSQHRMLEDWNWPPGLHLGNPWFFTYISLTFCKLFCWQIWGNTVAKPGWLLCEHGNLDFLDPIHRAAIFLAWLPTTAAVSTCHWGVFFCFWLATECQSDQSACHVL